MNVLVQSRMGFYRLNVTMGLRKNRIQRCIYWLRIYYIFSLKISCSPVSFTFSPVIRFTLAFLSSFFFLRCTLSSLSSTSVLFEGYCFNLFVFASLSLTLTFSCQMRLQRTKDERRNHKFRTSCVCGTSIRRNIGRNMSSVVLFVFWSVGITFCFARSNPFPFPRWYWWSAKFYGLGICDFY